MSRLNNKVAIITGAGSGIGKSTAEMFAKNGARLVISDLNKEAVERVASSLSDVDSEVVPMACDVTNYEDVQRLVSNAVQRFNRIDISVNNAGIGPDYMRLTHNHTLEDWHKVVSVNQTGVFYCMREVLTQMVDQGFGNIVNVASLAGLKASPSNLSYSASKFAVVGMTKSAAMEYAANNIRINAVCPGYTKSALLDKLLSMRPDMKEILLRVIRMKRFGEASEVAEAITWLASDQTQFITGQTITLDGGTSL